MLRSLALAVVLAALAPASAGAVVGERMIRYHDEADGVRVVGAGDDRAVRLDRTTAASKVWRKLSGRRIAVSCDVEDGAVGDVGVRARGRRIGLPTGAGSRVCAVATRQRSEQVGCDYEAEYDPGWCVRLTIALDDAGRAHVAEVVASLDLLTATTFDNLDDIVGNSLGQVMRLASPDATPPPGVIGVWESGRDFAAVVLSPLGDRRYLSRIGGVTSTNTIGLLQPGLPGLLG